MASHFSVPVHLSVMSRTPKHGCFFVCSFLCSFICLHVYISLYATTVFRLTVYFVYNFHNK